MKNLMTAAVAAAALLIGSAAQAAITLPSYTNVGHENEVLSVFTAATDGDITAYFAGSDAGFENEVGLFVNGVQVGGYGLNNKSSAVGQAFVFGSVHAGDTLEFVLRNVANTSGADIGPWSSIKANNTDGYNHVFSATFAGTQLGSSTLPANSIYVGFEDKPGTDPTTDLDYNDENFVFTNVAKTDVPEPASLAVVALGLGLMGAARRKSRK